MEIGFLLYSSSNSILIASKVPGEAEAMQNRGIGEVVVEGFRRKAMGRTRVVFLFCAVALGSMLSAGANASDSCGELKNFIGPVDYRTGKDSLEVVEIHHFTAQVEQLRAGITGPLGGDIDYTLRASPNHPRALMAMMRLGEKEKTERPLGARYSVACYFDRAIRFRADDPTVRMIYGTYLAKRKDSSEALRQLEMAEQLAADNANLHYNLGLVYFDLGKYEEALQHAHTAYRLGFTLPGLRNKLEGAGRWRAPPESASATKDGGVSEE